MIHARLATILALASVLLAGASIAQEEDPPGQEKPILLEKTVYVPFDRLDEILEKEGRSVYLPYEEFVRLWRKGQALPAPPRPKQPPAAVVLRTAVYEAAVEDGRVRVQATLDLESLQEGWAELALPLPGVAIEAVEVTSDQAVFAAKREGYALFLPGPGAYQLRLAFSLGVEESPGKKSVKFRLPPSAVRRVAVTIPETDLRLEVFPKTALAIETGEGTTKASVHLGQVEETTLTWSPAVERKVEETSIVSARQAVRAQLSERTLRIETAIHFEVLRGEVDSFLVEAPADTRAISVEGANLKEWGVEGDPARLRVRLHSPLARKDVYLLSLAFERILDDTPSALAIPLPRTLETLRESGHLVLSWAPALDVRITRQTGLSQLDPDDVPAALRPHLGLGFAWLAHPLALAVQAERITPVVRSAATSIVALGPEEDVWSGWIDFDVQKAGVFQLSFVVPAAWNVASVGTPETVEEFQTADDGERRTVTAQLRSKALGAFRLPFRLTRLGTAARGEQTLGPPEVVSTRQDRGLFGVSVPKRMEARTLERSRMTDADREELIRSGALGQLGSESSLPLAWRYREQPASVRLDLSEKARQIDATASHLVEIADGAIRVTHWIELEVLYAPADSIRIAVPSALDDLVQFEIKDKASVRKVSSEGGRSIHEIHVAPPILGPATLTVTHVHDLGTLPAGQSMEHVVAFVRSADAAPGSGFIAVRKEGTLEVQTTALEAEPVDPVDLPARLRRGKIDAAYRYYTAGPSLVLGLTRHDYQRLATTVVDRLHARSVLTRERKLRTKAVLAVQNTDRQYLELEIPPDRIRGLTVAGRNQPARKAPGGQTTLVEIPRGAFEVVVDYEETLDSDAMETLGSVEARTLALAGGDVPIGKVELDLYLPPEYRYLGFDGNLEEVTPARAGLLSSYERLLATFFGNPEPVERGGRGASPARNPGEAIQIELPTEGLVRRRFESLAPTGTVEFRFVGRKTWGFLQLLVLVAALAGARVLMSRSGDGAWRNGALLALVPVVALAFTGGALAETFAAMSLGALAVLAAKGGRAAALRVQAEKAARAAADPYLQPGKDA